MSAPAPARSSIAGVTAVASISGGSVDDDRDGHPRHPVVGQRDAEVRDPLAGFESALEAVA
jgi:hypothetical protein